MNLDELKRPKEMLADGWCDSCDKEVESCEVFGYCMGSYDNAINKEKQNGKEKSI